MRAIYLRSALVVVIAASLALIPRRCAGQEVLQPTPRQEESLKEFLQDYLERRHPGFERFGPTRYSAALVDLKDGGTREAIVYVTGRFWCGSGGCVTLVLTPKGTSYRVVASLLRTWPPIRVLKARCHGWHDIAFEVHGGGILNPYEDALSFNGKTYRAHERKVTHKAPGKVVIPATTFETGKRLYP